MGKLDEGSKGTQGKEAPDEPDGDLEDLDGEEDFQELEELELALKDLHPASLGRNSRRKLEERLEDLELKHQINDYDFKI